MVGPVEPGGGRDRAKLEDQPDTKQIGDAHQPEMRRADGAGEPAGGDAEWPLPYARGTTTVGAER